MSHSVSLPEPPETDLEYYARPENYTGSSLHSMTRFMIAKSRENSQIKRPSKKRKKLSDKAILYQRYHHILPAGFYDPSSRSQSECESDDAQTSPALESTNFPFSTTNILYSSRNCCNVSENKALVALIYSPDERSLQVPKNSDQHQETLRILPINGSTKRVEILDRRTGSTQDRPFSAFEHFQKNERVLLRKDSTGPPPSLRSKSALPTWGRRGSLVSASDGSGKGKVVYTPSHPQHKAIAGRFKKLIVAVKNVLKLARAIIKTSDSPSALLKTFTDLSRVPDSDGEESSSENMKKYGLHFDPSYFRANREINLSSEVRSILKLHPSRRTAEQIQTAMFGLQSIPSFAEYPLHMQEKLTKVAWLDIVTPNRTIIRQGHFAENFYFIVSGQALVTISRPGDSSAQTAAMMRKGTSFGELALLHHSRRTATVTSHDTVKLLSVGRDDFFDIFMSRQGTGEMPDHIKFISQLEFMKDWPLERLLERPDQCLLHFFKRNMVILKDSRTSEWFYVVKSGSCQVLKQLKGVTARLAPLRKQTLEPSDRLYRAKISSFQGSKHELKRRPHRNRSTSARPRDDYFEKNKTRKKRDMSHNDSSKGTCHDDHEGKTGSDLGESPHVTINDKDGQSEHALNSSQNRALQCPQAHEQPVFVQIELLKPMDVFGLDRVSFNNSLETESSSVSLVSLGAECIMLSKGFFMKYANDKVKKRFSEIVAPYPNENTLQESLQHKVNWELYKQSVLETASPKLKYYNKKQLTLNA